MLQVLIQVPVSIMREYLVQLSWCLDSSDESSSDDDVGRETNLARKRTGKSNPCKTCLLRTLPHATYSLLSPVHP
jgi:hypothetical protein